ncbi:MAG TPA: hypothetical protein VGL61_13615 [Kofleriaceae bacterium]
MSGPALDTQPAQTGAPPQPQPAPARASIPPVGATNTAADSAKTIQLLIHRRVAEASTALAGAPEVRAARAALAANQMNATLDDIRALAKLQPVDWVTLEPDLASLFSEIQELVTVVVADPSIQSEGIELQKALVELEGEIDPKVVAAARAKTTVPARPMTAGDSMALVRLEIAAARKQVAVFQAAAPGANRDRAAALAEPLHLHLQQAVAASLDVADRGTRIKLTGDVQALSADMSSLAQLLGVEPKLEWSSAFASAFDTENHLRSTIGLEKLARPYTGTIDPVKAAEAVEQMAEGKAPAASGRFTDPQAAVGYAEGLLDRVYASKQDAIAEFDSAIREKREVQTPWWETLVELAVTTALSAVSAGVGGMVSKSFERALTNAAKSRLPARLAGEGAYESDKRIEGALKDSSLQRAFLVDSAKDAAKNVTKAALEAGLAAVTGQHLVSTELVGQFIEAHKHGIDVERQSAKRAGAQLSAPLATLDLDALNALIGALESVPAQAHDLALAHAMYEWENLRARIATATQDDQDAKLEAPHMAIGETPIDGTLEVGIDVDPDSTRMGSSTLAYMVLRGGEPAALKELRREARAFGTIPMNRMYQLSFDRRFSDTPHTGGPDRLAGVAFVKVGVGARRGFQAGTLDSEELAVMERYVSKRDPIVSPLEQLGSTIGSALDDLTTRETPGTIAGRVAAQQRDLEVEQRAIGALKALISLADTFTTDKLEDA